MDSNSWDVGLSSLSKNYQNRSNVILDYEEFDDEEDDIWEEFQCPFCSEFYDIVELCCHVDDEHYDESNNGLCPVCFLKIATDMVAHITLQHGNIFKMQQIKRKSSKGGSHSSLSFLRKELQEGNFGSLFDGTSRIVSSSNAPPDPLLSSFIMPVADDVVSSQSQSLADTSFTKDKEEIMLERNTQSSPLSIKDQEEQTRRSTFVQEMLFSIILDDTL